MVDSAASAQPKMVVEGATKFYATQSGSVHALDNVSLEVREGEFLCILGPRVAARRPCSGRWRACTI